MGEQLLSEFNGSQESKCVKNEPLEEIEVKEEAMEIKKEMKEEYIEYDENKNYNKVLLLEKCKQLKLEKEEQSKLIRQLRMENEMLRKEARTQKKLIEQKNGAGGGKRKQSSPQFESGHKMQRNNVDVEAEAEVAIAAPALHVPIKAEFKPENNDDEVDFNHLSNSVSDPKLRDLSQKEPPEDIRVELMKTIVGGETEKDESYELSKNSVAVVSTVPEEENEVGSALELPGPADIFGGMEIEGGCHGNGENTNADIPEDVSFIDDIKPDQPEILSSNPPKPKDSTNNLQNDYVGTIL